MSRQRFAVADQPARFPRVSGDEPNLKAAMCEAQLFSPRERG